MEAAPAAAFVMSKPDLLLEFLIVALDAPAHLGKIDKPVHASTKLLCLHVIGVTAEVRTTPSCIARIRSRFPPSAQLSKMFIMNSVFLE